MAQPTYRDLLNADGSINASVLMRIAHAKARTERNAALCDAAGIRFSQAFGQRLGDASAFYARTAATIQNKTTLEPFATSLGRELRSIWQMARSMQSAARAGKAA